MSVPNEMNDRLSGLSPAKRKLLLQKLREQAAQREEPAASVPVLQPIPRDGELPLSFPQQRLWFLDRFEPGSNFYNVPAAFRLTGALDRGALARSLGEIVRRHETLRTTIETVDGRPVQRIAGPRPVEIEIVDLTGVDPAEREEKARAAAMEEAERPFHMDRGPLFRASLVVLAENEHLLILNLHHVISDGWSIGVLLHELSVLYTAFVQNQPSPLPELAVQYADFAAWQREHLQGESLEKHLAFWRRHLDGAPAALSLPTDRPRPAVQSFNGLTYSFRIPETLSKAVRDLCQREGVTLFMALLAAFDVLLYRLTGQDDVVVGAGIANRNRVETEPLIGFFVNTLAMRTRLAGNPTFRELLHQVREVSLGAYAHQDLPFEKLVEELRPERDLSRNPLVQVAFVLQNSPAADLALPGLTLQPFELEVAAAKFDWLLSLSDTEPEIEGLLEYNSDLFDPATVARRMGQYMELLEAVARDPEQRIRMVPLFADELGGTALPLNTTQRDLFLDHAVNPDGTIYSLGVSAPLGTQVDPERWRQALAAVFEQEPALRARFLSWHGEMLQVVEKDAALPFEIIDQVSDWDELVREKVKTTYRLEKGSLFRAYLVRGLPEGDVALLAYHHIVADALSGRLFLEKAAAIYEERNVAPSASFFQTVGESLAHFDTPEIQRFWADRLKSVTPLEVQSGVQHPGRQASSHAVLAGEDLAALRAFCEGRVSVAALLRGLFGVLLGRLLSPAGDFLLYDVVGGRPRGQEDAAGTIGCFHQVIPTVFEHGLLGEGAPVRALLESLREERRNLGQMRNLSVLLQRQLVRDEKIRFYYNFYDFAAFDLLGGRSILTVHDSFPENEVHLIVSDNRNELEIALHWNERWMSDLALIDRLLAMARQVVQGAAQLGDLEVLLESEHGQIFREWNDTAVSYPEPQNLHLLLEAQAERTPEATALVFEGAEMTYRELHARANQLAWHLRGLGVGPESVVALAIPRSFEMMIGLLAILKAGGAYLPLDPDYPQDRLRYMLSDSGARVLLLGEREIRGLEDYDGTVVRLGETLASQPVRPLACSTTGDNLAYIIYTSGSTGRPKGAMNSHRAIANRLLWMQAEYGITADDRVLQKTPLSFDVSVWELFWPLITGARLVIARPEGHKDGAYLVELIREQKITTLHFVPSMLRIWLEQRELSACRSLRRVICSGEALTLEHQERFFARFATTQTAELHNLYGPTEAAVDVTYWACQRQDSRGTVPIGHPVDNTQIHLLDRELRPVPVGIPGELYIGGVQLARGYHGRPDLTAEKFVADPWSDGGRLYRTGDLARPLPDGAIEYIGRIDHQIKLRGFRIELGEIESVLRRLPGVKEALVLVREDVPGDKALVAYLVAPPAGERPGKSEISGFAKQSLPDHMVPAHFVWLEEMPLLPNGKVDRRALPAPAAARPDLDVAFAAAKNDTEQKIVAIWQEVLRLPKVGAEDNFFDLGGHSLLLVQVQNRVQEAFGREIPVVELFRHPTARALARFLEGKDVKDIKDVKDDAQTRTSSAVAVIGLAGRFPGSRDLEDFWEKLHSGTELISFFSEEELVESGVDAALLARPGYVRAKAMLDGVDRFDAGFFGYTPREAEILDPQQRLFLEAAWEALENAGYDPQRSGGKVGVFAGQSFNTYLLENLWPNRHLMETVGLFQTVLGNDKDYLATRTSYKLGLRGPSINVQTACSTSLVAVHLACRSLLDGDCDMALAGGVSIGVPNRSGYLHQTGSIVSPDGHCAAFDVSAQGTVPGNGLGLVVLKRLDDALRDGDTIRAVIRGSAINNDGPDKVGFTAPSVDGQAEVIAQALERAGVGAETIGYVEAHGTGTPMGDPIEVAALTRVFRQSTDAVETVALGTLKSNLGHMDAAAGVAGLIKAVLALEHGAIPPSLHFQAPNPALGLETSPFYVNNHAVEWPRNGKPRRAGVSSFGIGGTNAHVVLEEAPAVLAQVEQTDRPHLLVLSAQTPSALEAQAERLAEHLRRAPEASLADIAWTLQAGRRVFAHRQALVVQDREDALATLAGSNPQRVWDRFEEGAEPSVAFLFPGQGAQHAGMAAGLYAAEPGFRRRVDECAVILAPRIGMDLRELLYPEPERREEASRKLERTAFAQPALFTIEYALAGLWMDRGIRPAALLGHSVGEFVAATLAGVMELPDALELVALRGRLIDALPEGAMLSVELPESELAGLLGPDLSLAAVNGPSSCVVAGDFEAVDALAQCLAEKGVVHRRLHTSHAFHSAAMDAAMQPFADAVGRLDLQHPKIPYVSGMTGTWITARQATDPWYWARHLRETVRFADGVRTLAEGTGRVLLEVGPGSSLTSLSRRQLGEGSGVTTISSLPHPKDRATDLETVTGALGRLWLCGARIDWRAVHGSARRRIPLPSYPFERQRYWIEAPRNGMSWSAAEPVPAALTVHEGPRRTRSFDPPQTEIEETIAAVWQELLGIEQVGRNDGFFDLGGHSLSAVQLIARLQERLPVELAADVLFDRPTVAALAELVEEQLVDHSGEDVAVIPRRDASVPAPLSFAQQRIWFIDQLEPGSPAYTIAAALRLDGALDRGALERSFTEILRRHEVLRTTFGVVDGAPVQVIHPARPAEIPLTDLTGLPEDERRAAVHALAREEGSRPFDLARGPLLRLGLVRLAPREHVLLLAISHSISDGWSIGLLIQELAALYRAFRAGLPSPLPELAAQYADFAVWQRQYLQGERLETQVDYWKRQLAGAPPLLELPADRPRPPLQSVRGAMLPLAVPADELARFKALCQAHGATLYMGLLAAWQALLHRYTGQREIVVGSPVANRRRVELETLIGFFANTLVLRTDLAGDPSFAELLGRVQTVARGAYAHQDVPFERLVEELHPERHLSYTPLFQVMLVLQNAPMPDLALAELTLSTLDFDPGVAKFDLLLNVAEGEDGGLTGVLEYSTDLFDQDRMERLLQHFRVLLGSAAAEPERPLSMLPILTAEERDRVLFGWNDNAVDHPRVPVHEPVEEQAERTPEALAAVWSEDETAITYRELSHRANQLAHHLRSMGVGPDERVAICLDRSLDLLVSVLGVLKAGGAYVPVDSGYPADRVAYMLADSRSRVLVTTGSVAAGLPDHEVPSVFLDLDRDAIATRSTANPPRETTPDHLAYVIYTSGSTGRPKGVAMPHGVLSNLLMWQRTASAAGVGSRTLQFASLSFDVSFQEIFSTWWTGGTLVAIPQETRRDALALCRVLHEKKVERLFLPFVALQQIAEAIEHGAPVPEKLAEIVTAGEQLQITRQIARWLETSGAILENQYGPSEGHVVTAHRLAGKPDQWPTLPPIGKPLPNVAMYLLDRHFEPVPQGVPGHLYFGGAQVVRGYLDRPELTAEKFVPNPFGESGARLYATGDQARYLTDGTIQFLGRIDHQVKIRGFRVEPGEVETALAKHPQVREAAVVVRGDAQSKRLIGYYVAGEDLTSADLRAFLKEELPEYMVPALLVRLDALPLTPSGKVHREALPAPDQSTETRRAFTAPRNAIEETVAGIWMEVLNLPRVDVHDDFFELGGHSLTATRLIYGVRKAFNLDLPLRTLFAGPTVAALAEAIANLKKGPTANALPVMKRDELIAEAILDASIQGQFTPLPLAGEGPGVRALLLTGATGFLGAFLLRELLQQFPSARVHTLVRAANETAARRKLVASLEKFNLWDDAFAERIEIVNGDLAQPLLGLSQTEFQRLGEEIDAIYHNGAFVNLFYAYSTLKPANVLGTQEVLRLATLGKVKPVHYVSTAGVFFSAGGPALEEVDEETALEAVSGLMGGYAQSKWVAEKLVHLASERGIPVTVYRPGRIGGHSRTGLGNPDDLVFRILKGSIQLGAAPLLDMEVEMSPVDYVSGALVHLSRQPESVGKTFHLVNPRVVAWNELLDWIDTLGRPLRRLAWADWQAELRSAAERSTDNVLYPLLPVLAAEPSAEAGESAEDDARAPRIGCVRTQAALAGSGIECPRLDAALLGLYLDRLSPAIAPVPEKFTEELAVSR